MNTNFSKFFAQIWHFQQQKKRPCFLRSVGRGQHNKKFFWPYDKSADSQSRTRIIVSIISSCHWYELWSFIEQGPVFICEVCLVRRMICNSSQVSDIKIAINDCIIWDLCEKTCSQTSFCGQQACSKPLACTFTEQIFADLY